jgi:hypothetical protein
MIKYTKGKKTKFIFPNSNLIQILEKDGWKKEKKKVIKKRKANDDNV